MAHYEAAMCRAFDAVLTVTQEDRNRLLALFPASERERLAGKFDTIPICVEPGQVKPALPAAARRAAYDLARGNHVLAAECGGGTVVCPAGAPGCSS